MSDLQVCINRIEYASIPVKRSQSSQKASWLKIRNQLIENPPVQVQFLEQLGNHWHCTALLRFSLGDTWMWSWEVALILTYTTEIILGKNFRNQNKETNSRIFIEYMRDDIALKSFWNTVAWKCNNIKFLSSFMALSWCLNWRSLTFVIKRKFQYAVKCHWLPWLLQKLAQVGFSTCWIQLCSLILSSTTAM